MCEKFFDIRTFGTVMSTSVNCEQVHGPMQLTFARSVDPVVPMDVSITRVAVTKEEDAKVVTSDEGETSGKETEMGRKALVPYGLYRGHGFYNPMLARDMRFDAGDLGLFWKALKMGWELDRSASRGLMALRGLLVFSHDDALGNAPAHQLFDRIHFEDPADEAAPARSFDDYHERLTIDDAELPDGVTLTYVVDPGSQPARTGGATKTGGRPRIALTPCSPLP